MGGIQSLRLDDVQNSFLTLAGPVGSLTAADWQGGTLEANTLGTLKVAGEWNADLTLNPGSSTRQALGSASLGSLSDSIWDVGGFLGSVTLGGSANGWTLGTQGAIGSLNIGDKIQNSTINALGRIGSLRAAQWEVTDLTARSLGTLRITGAKTAGVPGDLLFSNLTLTGASGRVSLGELRIAGSVANSTFKILGGDVTSFTCARFLSSCLYVGFTPPANGGFDSLGTFLGPWKLATFTTTTSPAVPYVSDPRTDAFQDSQIVASRFGQVVLTGVNISNGVPIGLRVNGAANAGIVLIGTAPFRPGVPVKPGTHQGEFEFLDS